MLSIDLLRRAPSRHARHACVQTAAFPSMLKVPGPQAVQKLWPVRIYPLLQTHWLRVRRCTGGESVRAGGAAAVQAAREVGRGGAPPPDVCRGDARGLAVVRARRASFEGLGGRVAVRIPGARPGGVGADAPGLERPTHARERRGGRGAKEGCARARPAEEAQDARVPGAAGGRGNAGQSQRARERPVRTEICEARLSQVAPARAGGRREGVGVGGTLRGVDERVGEASEAASCDPHASREVHQRGNRRAPACTPTPATAWR